MYPTIHRIMARSLILVSTLLLMTTALAAGQENPPANPIDLPCVTNASAQVLGTTLVNDGTQNLVQVRIIFDEGGKIDLHSHPGTLIMTVESGSFGFTHHGDGEMQVNRAATTETEATVEPLPHGEEVVINPGDWLVESGMIHTGANLADGQTTVLLTGLIEPGQPLTTCVNDASPAASSFAFRD